LPTLFTNGYWRQTLKRRRRRRSSHKKKGS
jgi:hypothetical protein